MSGLLVRAPLRAPMWPPLLRAPVCPPIWSSVSPHLQTRRRIVSRAFREKGADPLPAPWPYQTKGYNYLHALLFDRKTSKRLNENSKVLVVDGPLAAGKTALAKALANDLDMLYFPEANMDMLYLTPYGYDLRQLDSQMPHSCKSYDAGNFHREPKHENTANFQMEMYRLRFFQYVSALAHVLNTGQGVVLDRSVYSDTVFLESMAAEGFVSPAARSVYHEVRTNTISELMRPHLLIYLDVPVKEVKLRLQKRPIEANSKVLLESQFVERMEEEYKRRYLPEMGKHSKVLVYEWPWSGESLPADASESVVEDVERVQLDGFEKHDSLCADWRLPDEDAWNTQRHLYTNRTHVLQCYFNVPRNDVPELMVSGEDLLKHNQIWWGAPGMAYRKGFNDDSGDHNLLFKTK